MFIFCKARWARQDKKWKENHATKVTKIPKIKRQKYGMGLTLAILAKFGTFKSYKFKENAISIKNTDKLLMPLHKTSHPTVYQVGVSSLKMKIEEETHCGTQFSKMKCRKSLSQVS